MSLITLTLVGSTRNTASSKSGIAVPAPDALVTQLNQQGRNHYTAGHYSQARSAFLQAAERAGKLGAIHASAMNWNNAGGAALASRQYKIALDYFEHARLISESAGETSALAYALNNLASLNIQIGNYEAALHITEQALDFAEPAATPNLLLQKAAALTKLGRFTEGEKQYFDAIDACLAAPKPNLETVSRAWGNLGGEYLKHRQITEANWALTEALRLIRIHHLPPSSLVLANLARVRDILGEFRNAVSLFDEAVQAPERLTPRWFPLSERGNFRFEHGDLQGALDDFGQARSIESTLRVGVIPTDRDRIAIETGLSRIGEGIVEAGNLLFEKTRDPHLLNRTFDAAEDDRMWSLRSLIPAGHDWRDRLPPAYWDQLARLQALEKKAAGNTSAEAASLKESLHSLEAAAGASSEEAEQSPLLHVRGVLDDQSVFLSFHLGPRNSWVWALTPDDAAVARLLPEAMLAAEVKTFREDIRQGKSNSPAGTALFGHLFGGLSAKFLSKKKWLLELDGALYELPFAALPNGDGSYLLERATLQIVPGAGLLRVAPFPAQGTFLGIGDPILNGADPRDSHTRKSSGLTLPRLPNTAREVSECARAWSPTSAKILTGSDATLEGVRDALAHGADIIHFATHTIPPPDDSSGGRWIALSLDAGGAPGLLSPKEIVSRPSSAALVVMSGCYSAEGQSLPRTGLVGLTRAWIGAGVSSVLATQWNLPDGVSQSLMTAFYRALRSDPRKGPANALRQAQLTMLKGSPEERNPGSWATYFLMSRN